MENLWHLLIILQLVLKRSAPWLLDLRKLCHCLLREPQGLKKRKLIPGSFILQLLRVSFDIWSQFLFEYQKIENHTAVPKESLWDECLNLTSDMDIYFL